MTTLQEAVQEFIEATKLDRIEWEDWPRDSQTAFESLRNALAQQGAQQPVAWYEYNQDLDAWFLAYGHNPKAKTRPLVFGDTAAPAQKPVAYITQTEQGPMVWTPEMYDEACTYCDDGEFPVPLYTAAPAPQAQDKSDNYLSGYCTGRTDLLKEQSAQQESACPECHCHFIGSDVTTPGSTRLVNTAPQPAHTNEDAARFKAQHQFLEWNRQQDESLVKIAHEYGVFEKAIELYKEALQSAQPVAQPLAKTCDTCAHYQQGKRPGVSIHDETCYGCSEYYANKWEAKSE